MTNEILHGAALRHAGACACIALLSAAYGANGWVYDTSQRIAETRCDREVALSSKIPHGEMQTAEAIWYNM